MFKRTLFYVGVMPALLLCLHLKAENPSNNYEKIDNLALHTPQEAVKSIESLVWFGEKNTKTEAEKVRFFFVWVAQNIFYDTLEWSATKRLNFKQEPEIVFQNRQAMCKGYADLFDLMCQKSHISSKIITGYSKTIDDKLNRNELHAWNAIKVGNTWQLYDVTWASNYLYYNKTIDEGFETYFMQSPRPFLKRHFPFDPVWQLSTFIVTPQEFFSPNALPYNNHTFQRTTQGEEYGSISKGVSFERPHMGNYLEIIESEQNLDIIEQNIRSFQRAVNFVKDEKRIMPVLNYFKSEKANLYYKQALTFLENFGKIDEETFAKWTYSDAFVMYQESCKSKALLEKSLYLYETMPITIFDDEAVKKSNMISIRKNLTATESLMNFLNKTKEDLKRMPIKKVERIKER